MTPHQIQLIRTTWQLAAANPQVAGQLFYSHLFEIAPQLKGMFSRTTIPEQSKKLMAMLSYIISKLDSLEDILGEVAKLAQRHVNYGVEEEHYTYVGSALLSTLQQALGDNWNEEVGEAWTTCFGILSSAMINTAQYENRPAA